jgi:hypothetical protein
MRVEKERPDLRQVVYTVKSWVAISLLALTGASLSLTSTIGFRRSRLASRTSSLFIVNF